MVSEDDFAWSLTSDQANHIAHLSRPKATIK
jgi:hypothetical protein